MKPIRWLTLSLALLASPLAADSPQELVVYSARNEHLIKPLFDAYTQQSGVAVRYITDKEGPLLARLKAEGANTPADLLITVDAGNLWQAAEEGVLAEVNSALLQEKIPAHLRDPQQRWFGLSVRARTLVYSTERVKPEQLSSYEALAEPQWKGRLCLRTAKKVYNQSLVAMMIARLGEEKTEQVVRGWVANLATEPFSNDTLLMEAIAAGQCDVGIVNTYYFGRLQQKQQDIPLALFWPNQGNGGVHVNLSGAGVTRHSNQPQQAIHLLEWLASDQAQGMFGGLNLEFPANPNIALDPQVAAWGAFQPDPQNLATAGKLQTQAVKLMDRAGYR